MTSAKTPFSQILAGGGFVLPILLGCGGSSSGSEESVGETLPGPEISQDCDARKQQIESQTTGVTVTCADYDKQPFEQGGVSRSIR